jgi:hypothetical protein
MGRPSNAINEIVNGKKVITAETALQLDEVMPEIPADRVFPRPNRQENWAVLAGHPDI